MSRDIFEKTSSEKIFVDEVTTRAAAPEKNIAILLIEIIIYKKEYALRWPKWLNLFPGAYNLCTF